MVLDGDHLLLVGNQRVARRRYWYSGTLHTMIWWGFIVLQVRTLNFLLNGVDHDISFEGRTWEVEARRDNVKRELRVDPKTGEVISDRADD